MHYLAVRQKDWISKMGKFSKKNDHHWLQVSLNLLFFQLGRNLLTCQETTLEAPINHDNSTELHMNARIQNVFNWSIRGIKIKRA